MTASEDMRDSPGGRIGHICGSDSGYMFVLGGYNGYNNEMQTNYLAFEELWIYDSLLEKWFMRTCSPESGPTDIPAGTSGACCCAINGFLYMFGGYNDEGNSNSLYRLDLRTFRWKLLEPLGKKPLPSDKSVCFEYDNKFFVFAGYGCIPTESPNDRNYQFVLDPKSHWHYKRGWNNQLVYYDTISNQWIWPSTRGRPPIPRAAHTAARVGHRVFVFGGRHQTLRMNDMFSLDLKNMVWTSIKAGSDESVPRGRSWHSLTPLSDRQLVLFGGFTQNNEPLSDCWTFDVQSLQWHSVDLAFDKPRLWHSATLSPFGEIVVYGGAKKNILNPNNLHYFEDLYSKDIIVLRFCPKSLLRLCLDATVYNYRLLETSWQYVLPQNIKHLLELRKTALLSNSDGS